MAAVMNINEMSLMSIATCVILYVLISCPCPCPSHVDNFRAALLHYSRCWKANSNVMECFQMLTYSTILEPPTSMFSDWTSGFG